MVGRGRLLLGISVLWAPLAFLFDGVTVLMLPLRVDSDASRVGIISLVGLGLATALQPIAGLLSDRYRERVDRRAFIAAAAVPAVLGLWLFAGTTGFVAAVVGYIVLQIGASVLQAAQQTLIPEYVEAAARGRASGLKTSFDIGGALLAFSILGVVLGSGDLVGAAVVVTVFLLTAIAVVLALVPRRKEPAPSNRLSGPLPAGLAPLIASRFLFLFASYAVGRFLVLLVGERLAIAPEQGVEEAGWLLAVFTLTTAVVALPLGWRADRRSRLDLMVGGSCTAAVGILLLVPSAGFAGVLAGGLLMSFGTAAFMTGNWAATTALVPPADAGRLMGIANLGTGFAAAAAGALGPLIEAVGFIPALIVAATASAAAAVPLIGRPLEHPIPREKLA